MCAYADVQNKEKAEAIRLLKEQIQVEGKLVGLYERTHKEIENRPVRHILHTIQLDSRKHIRHLPDCHRDPRGGGRAP